MRSSLIALCSAVSVQVDSLKTSIKTKPVRRSALLQNVTLLRSALSNLSDNADSALRKKVRVAMVSTDGLIRGLENKLYSLSDLRRDMKIANKAYAAIEESAGALPVEEEQPEVSVSSVPRGSDFKEVLRVFKDALVSQQDAARKAANTDENDTDEDAETQKLRDQLEKVRRLESELPERIKGVLYGVARLPIVAIFKHNPKNTNELKTSTSVIRNFTRFGALSKIGLEFVKVDDYLILLNQTVMMVKARDVRAYLTGIKDDNDAAYKEDRKEYRKTMEAEFERLRKKRDKFATEDDAFARVINASTEKEKAAIQAQRSAFRARFADVADLHTDEDIWEYIKANAPKKEVAVDTGFLDAKSIRPNSKKLAGAATEVNFVREQLAQLNEHLTVKYELVSERAIRNPKNPNILLFWLMPSRTLKALRAVGWHDLQQWDLPFDK